MKTSLFNVLVVIVVIGVALPMVGGTLATWSDSETMMGNYIETGSLDILVAECDANGENPGPFNDDPPWGVGLESCFNIPELELCTTYPRYRLLWNAGCVDGTAYLHIKNVADSNGLSSNTTMDIWYDDDGDPETPLVLVESDTIGNLACEEIELGVLPGEATRQLKLEIHADEGAASDVLSFDISFELVQLELCGPTYAWADTEKSPNELTLPLLFEGCTPGFWQGGNGKKLWNEANDPHWTAAGGSGTNPYIHTTLFNGFFTPHPDLAGLTMMDLAGTGGGSNPVHKAARDLVAAYLNASFGMNYPLDTTELDNLWNAAVTTGVPTFTELHLMLDGYNKLGCPLCD